MRTGTGMGITVTSTRMERGREGGDRPAGFAVMDAFLVRAGAAGVGVAVAAAPLGCLLVWNRLAFFGDTLAHAALLGVALGLLLEVGLTAGVLGVGVVVALALALMGRERRVSSDTTLAILSYSCLAFGLVALGFLERVRVDLLGYLFGDILAVTAGDLWWIAGGGSAALAAVALLWRPLLALTAHEELAAVEGVPVERVRTVFLVALAVVVAVAMQVVGVLLTTALLVMPAAAARPWSRTPEAMAALAAGLGSLAVVAGLAASWFADSPAGPSIVAAAAVFVLASRVAGRLARL